jgi:hypothetical protein
VRPITFWRMLVKSRAADEALIARFIGEARVLRAYHISNWPIYLAGTFGKSAADLEEGRAVQR